MPGASGLSVKSKRRSSEKRKAKSRDAARIRRSNEAEIFNDLTLEIPLPLDVLAHCDKSSLIRLVICRIKLQTFITEGLKRGSNSLIHASDSLFMPALDGFLMVLTNSGDLIFITDNIFSMLGISQVDMLGQKIYDFIHPCDHDCIRSEISVREDEDHVFFVRMRTSYNSKSHCLSVRTPDYKVVCCTGHSISVNQSDKLLSLPDKDAGHADVEYQSTISDDDLYSDKSEKSTDNNILFTVIIGRMIVEPETHLKLDCCSFVTRHSPNMKCVYCDERISTLLGYRPEDLIGRSLYEYHHPLDDDLVKKAYKTLFTSGQMMIPCYRFMRRKGGYSWIETRAVILGKQYTQQQRQQQQQSSRAQEVMCIHCIISEPKDTRSLMSEVQDVCNTGESNRTLKSLLTCKTEDCINDRLTTEPHHSEPEEVIMSRLNVVAYDGDDDDYDDIVGNDDDDNEDCMQFMTEEVLGLTSADSRKIFEKLLKPDYSEDINDQMENMYEMKAPYIPMDDMSFGPIVDLKDFSLLDSLTNLQETSQSLDRDLIFSNISLAERSQNQTDSSCRRVVVDNAIVEPSGVCVSGSVGLKPDSVQASGTSSIIGQQSNSAVQQSTAALQLSNSAVQRCNTAEQQCSSAVQQQSNDKLLLNVSSGSQIVNDLINICSRPNRTPSENDLLEQLILGVNECGQNEEFKKCANKLIGCMDVNDCAASDESRLLSGVTFVVDDDDDVDDVINDTCRKFVDNTPSTLSGTSTCNSPSDYIILDGACIVGSLPAGSLNIIQPTYTVPCVSMSTINAQGIKLDSYGILGDVASEVVCTTEADNVRAGAVSVSDISSSLESVQEVPSVVYVDLYVENDEEDRSPSNDNDDDDETDDALELDNDDDDDNVRDDVGMNSVLKNLLVHGVDVNYGYQLRHPVSKPQTNVYTKQNGIRK